MAVVAKGDWKEKRLTRPDEVLTERVTEEVLTDTGAH
jgi:hypothetical protein